MAKSKVGETNKRLIAEKHAGGRPSIYTPELAAYICAQIAEGKSVRTICLPDDMPHMTTIFEWIANRPEFSKQYAYARDMQADKMAEETIQIADDGLNDTYLDDDGNKRTDHDVIARSRLRVDARKWYASKLAPKKYGDRITQEHTGAGGGAIETSLKVTFVDSNS
jgi:hypothetical protein